MAAVLREADFRTNAFAVHENHRVSALRDLIAALRGFKRDGDRNTFTKLFCEAITVLELDDLELARELRVSRPTIGRWVRGESAPHPLARQPVLSTLISIAERKIKRHTNGQRFELDEKAIAAG
jgi:transcriptional regulator with XRE-family HTH domain